jgi:hypothetical protein
MDFFVDGSALHVFLAMQKVEASNPFSRFERPRKFGLSHVGPGA